MKLETENEHIEHKKALLNWMVRWNPFRRFLISTAEALYTGLEENATALSKYRALHPNFQEHQMSLIMHQENQSLPR